VGACSSLPANVPRAPSRALADAAGTGLGKMVAGAAPAGRSSRSDSAFRLLGDSQDAYTTRLALIDAAEKTLDLQYYAIHFDNSSAVLLQRLREAARRGVRVRILLDDFNAAGRNIEVLRLDLEPGIEIRMFNPVAGSRASLVGRMLGSVFDFQRIQQRMHNKAFIADNALAITGGRNLGDEYFGQGQQSNFLDLDVLTAGRVVQDISRSFDHYWNDTLAYPVQSLLTPDELKNLRETPQPAPALPVGPADAHPPQVTPASLAAAQANAPHTGTDPARWVWAPAALLVDQPSKIGSDDPADTEETVVEGLLQLVQQAKSDLLIVSPYFVPGERMMQVFTQLRQRGVRVRVLTNSLASNDAPLAHVGYARYRVALLQTGVELYELRSDGATRRRLFGSAPTARASLHSKALIMDGRLVAIGSMNLDLRSTLQNTEMSLVIRSSTIARELSANIEQTVADSYRLEWSGKRLFWHPPRDSSGATAAQPLTSEPDASTRLKLLLRLIGPFAPEEML
jgi:cardiolipin synthase C